MLNQKDIFLGRKKEMALLEALYISNPAYDSGLQNAIDKILKIKKTYFIQKLYN